MLTHDSETHVVRALMLTGVTLLFIAVVVVFGLVVSCGSSPIAPKILPPNTEQACDRAIVCDAFLFAQRDACISCLEHVDPRANESVKEYLRDNPIESLPCDRVVAFAHQTNLSSCVVGQWYGP